MKLNEIHYPSPVIRFDAVAQDLIIQRLDPATGEVSEQIPDVEVVKRDRLAALASHPLPAAIPSPSSSAILAQTVASGSEQQPSPGPSAEAAAAPPSAEAGGAPATGTRLSVIV